MAKVTGYKVVVQGQYHAHDGVKGKTRKFYEKETFYLPETVEYREGLRREFRHPPGKPDQKISVLVPVRVKANALRVVQHLIQRYYLPPRLRERYPDFIALRTCNILSKEKVDLDDKSPESAGIRAIGGIKIADMTESELLLFKDLHNLNTELTSYADLADMKLAIEEEFREKNKRLAGLKPAAESKTTNEVYVEEREESSGEDENEELDELLA